MEMKLSALTRGERAYIRRVESDCTLAGRLTDLGMTPGTGICCELVGPAGGMAAYRVRGALVALRRPDADRVWVVRRCPEV